MSESLARGVISAREQIQGRGYSSDHPDGSTRPAEIEASEMQSIMLRSENAATDEDTKSFFKQMALDYGDGKVPTTKAADEVWDFIEAIFADVDRG